MHKILELRENYRLLYSKYSMYIEAIVKFVIALVAIIVINSHIGAMELLTNPLVVILLSLVCAVLPRTLSAVVVMLVIVGHMFSISMEIAIIVLVMFIVMYLLFFRFTPKESVVLVVTPILCAMGIPYILPIVLGLVASPVSIVSLAFGTLVYFIMSFISNDYENIMEIASEDGFEVLSMFIEDVIKSSAIYYCIAVFAVVLVLVYVLKRLSMDYSWIVGVCTGGVIQIVMFIVGNVIVDMSLFCGILSAVLGGLICTGVAWLLQFFLHSVDYTKAEKVQFEDDDYYYYVKAVPKIKVNMPKKNSKKDIRRNVRVAGQTSELEATDDIEIVEE